MNLDIEQVTSKTALTALEQSVIACINGIRYKHSGSEDSLIKMSDLSSEKIKAFTTASGFSDVTPEDLGFSIAGTGGFTDFADCKETATANPKFTHIVQNGRYVPVTFNPAQAPVTNTLGGVKNDIATAFSVTLALEERIADVYASTNELATSLLPSGQIVATVVNVLRETKKYDSEVAMANHVFTNPSVVEMALPTGVNSAPIHSKMKEMISLRLPFDETKEKSVFVMSREVFGRLIAEKNTQSDFINRYIQSGFERLAGGPDIGYVGDFDTYKVYVSDGIGTSYALTSNRITALTGGTASAIVFGRPKQFKIRTSGQDNERVEMFNIEGGTPSLVHLQNGAASMHMVYRGKEGILNPSLVRYCAIPNIIV